MTEQPDLFDSPSPNYGLTTLDFADSYQLPQYAEPDAVVRAVQIVECSFGALPGAPSVRGISATVRTPAGVSAHIDVPISERPDFNPTHGDYLLIHSDGSVSFKRCAEFESRYFITEKEIGNGS